jgi:hypothetical protein
MDQAKLAAITGIVVSLLFSYFPGLATWYEKLPGDYKRLVMLVALLLTTAGAFGLACAGRKTGLTCDQPGIWQAIEVFIGAAIASQSTYLLTPKLSSGAVG